ncbi:PQQ-dependent sugar dehydrogenase [Ferruginibacter albus]|uniref:PQQ-dependent sugar dehydrogenase n=1 Tax=Ferruginibacter albus TaxID=2875540 RepID=UPI001CC5DF7B|nr:PQQ-dependent sugar dehydrogenase [Ferruginibacter albus]UAY52794.1 PQQ-dependent sugar dehydrogenase [Ferruginibacter albus]
MRKILYFFLIICLFDNCQVFAQGEIFSTKTLINANTSSGRFRHPFAMVMGPDDSLWVTEKRGYVIRINRTNGGKTELLDIHSKVRFTTTVSGGKVTGIGQDGLLGIALHPELNKGTGNDYVYLSYCYDSSGIRRMKIVRYTYNRSVPSLTNELTLLKGLPGSNDHNSGRLVIGNVGTYGTPDYKLFYTIGDQGANQFDNSCDTIKAQYTPTALQLSSGDLSRYVGKVLRMNLDGSIPADNPVFNGVRSHIYTIGHRNPQGLAFEKDITGQLVPQGKLYGSEQGPATDDEINLIESGKNYGWPRVAGKLDNGWYRYFSWGASGSCNSYSGECSSQQVTTGIQESTFSDPNYKDPIFDMYPNTPAGGVNCNWLANPTVAPSSIAYYYFPNKIPNWGNSLLIPTLKTSALLRLKLDAAGTGIVTGTDTIEYFKNSSALNRLRDIVIANDGITFYLLTDSVGSTSGPSSGSDGGVTDRGGIIMYKYTGTVLALNNDVPEYVREARLNFKFYPIPTSKILNVECKQNTAKPLRYNIYDAAGKLVLQGTNTHDKFEINVEGLFKGIYIIKLFDGYNRNVITDKIVVN